MATGARTCCDRLYMFTSGGIIVRQQNNVGTLQERSVFEPPFLGAPGAAGCGKPKPRIRSTFFSPSAMQIVWPAAIAFNRSGQLIGDYRRGGVENLPLARGRILAKLGGVEIGPILPRRRAHIFAGLEAPQPTLVGFSRGAALAESFHALAARVGE